MCSKASKRIVYIYIIIQIIMLMLRITIFVVKIRVYTTIQLIYYTDDAR